MPLKLGAVISAGYTVILEPGKVKPPIGHRLRNRPIYIMWDEENNTNMERNDRTDKESYKCYFKCVTQSLQEA